MANGIIYLRPSADVEINHQEASGNSTEFGDFYTLINEEVSDEATTYIISSKTQSSHDVASIFEMSGITPNNKFNITKATIYISAWCATSSDNTVIEAHSRGNVVVGENTASFSISFADFGSFGEWLELYCDIDDLVQIINDYIEINGTFPAITLEYSTGNTLENNSKSLSVGTSQIYIELEYSTDIGVHIKSKGTWLSATQAFQKVNGAWVEITEDECKSILQGN